MRDGECQILPTQQHPNVTDINNHAGGGGGEQANKTQLKATLVRQVAKTSICPLPESCDGEKWQSIVLIQIT